MQPAFWHAVPLKQTPAGSASGHWVNSAAQDPFGFAQGRGVQDVPIPRKTPDNCWQNAWVAFGVQPNCVQHAPVVGGAGVGAAVGVFVSSPHCPVCVLHVDPRGPSFGKEDGMQPISVRSMHCVIATFEQHPPSGLAGQNDKSFGFVGRGAHSDTLAMNVATPLNSSHSSCDVTPAVQPPLASQQMPGVCSVGDGLGAWLGAVLGGAVGDTVGETLGGVLGDAVGDKVGDLRN